ncbi:MAG: AAA family ATPase [Candidatus Sumerlaeota bacterium]|nr:AAA family ATPase [Candidatus Sumerlaeota bacterium]
MYKRLFAQIWDQLRAKRPQMTEFLEEIRIQEFRGIRNLSVRFSYPVTVLAGPNACGKSTILFALACAYKRPHPSARHIMPSWIFPDFRSKHDADVSDHQHPSKLEFSYVHGSGHARMKWRRGANKWNRSYTGDKSARNPERHVLLRTLENLNNPSTVRHTLQMARKEITKEEISADVLEFAHRIMPPPLHYRRLFLLSREDRSLFFAERENGQDTAYSEFHMSAGERAILRLAKDLADKSGGLILIDEVEAGLHPTTQRRLMLELQRLALRHDLQIVVATHSLAVLESVPQEARIFLERTGDNAVIIPPYRDLIQKSLYSQTMDKLSILCEDEMAEALLLGIFDVLNPKLNLCPSDIEVGRNTGKSEFPQHVRAFAKFDLLDDFLFVIDGDATLEEEDRIKQASYRHGPVRLLRLPGEEAPERWIWSRLHDRPEAYAKELGLTAESLHRLLLDMEQLYSGATDTPRNIAKGRLASFAHETARTEEDIARLIGRTESQDCTPAIKRFLADLEESVTAWRHLASV